MSETQPSRASEPVTPEAIWDKATGINHETYVALARRIWGDAKNEVELDGFALSPFVVDIGPQKIVLLLRASGRFEDHLVQFDEAATVTFETEIELSLDEVTEFGNEIALPYLLPYVEMGFTRLCAEVGQKPPTIPFYVVRGELFTTEEALTTPEKVQGA